MSIPKIEKNERVVAYIDGFNLYFGIRDKGWKKYYWLDLWELIIHLLKSHQKPVNGLFLNSYFYCLSKYCYGLQLADLAAYTINRSRYYDYGNNNAQNGFIEYIHRLYTELKHKMVNFLDPDLDAADLD